MPRTLSPSSNDYVGAMDELCGVELNVNTEDEVVDDDLAEHEKAEDTVD